MTDANTTYQRYCAFDDLNIELPESDREPLSAFEQWVWNAVNMGDQRCNSCDESNYVDYEDALRETLLGLTSEQGDIFDQIRQVLDGTWDNDQPTPYQS